jgi:hypothetical protein
LIREPKVGHDEDSSAEWNVDRLNVERHGGVNLLRHGSMFPSFSYGWDSSVP